jgi:hypothetical protein
MTRNKSLLTLAVVAMNLRNRTKTALTVVAFAATLCIGSSSATAGIIISETFSLDPDGDTTALVGTTTPDGNDWLGASNTTYMQDGSLSSTAASSAYLPFTLTQGLIYTLQVDITPAGSGSNWLGTGFSLTANDGNGAPNVDGGTAYAWMILRASGDAPTFTGANTSGTNANISSWVGNTVTIVLDTTNAADYTVEYFDGSGSRGGPNLIGAPAIGHVFIGNDTMDGSFDNLTLSDNTAISELLTLQVDTLTGVATVLGDLSFDIDLNFYEITSAGNSLDPDGWNSIEDQDDIGGGFPAANPAGSGNGWEESGSIGTHALAEGFLLGSSTLGAGESIALGAIYDGGAQDWEFSYNTATGGTEVGLVEFVSGGCIAGDYDCTDLVAQGDLDLVLLNWAEPVPPTPAGWVDQIPADGFVDQDDLDGVLLNWANTPLAAATAAVPEPSSLLLLALGTARFVSRRRK